MDDKTLTKIQSKSFFPELIEHITSGGALPNLCQLLEIRYSQVVEWIYSDPDRSSRYDKALQARNEWVIQSILNELKDIGLADIRAAYDSNNTLLPVSQWPAALARTVQAVEVQEDWEGQGSNRIKIGETKRLKMWDKLRALELLGKNLKLFKEQVEHSGQVSLEDMVAQSMEDPTKQAPQIKPDPVRCIPKPSATPTSATSPNFGLEQKT